MEDFISAFDKYGGIVYNHYAAESKNKAKEKFVKEFQNDTSVLDLGLQDILVEEIKMIDGYEVIIS